ncbi:hypothetical protein IMZ48_27390, partial [Candidatus Bathyarchaeota archaeon]|nr:hypothetical protein [Candidatus Bathyarchaeota archaeon]
LQASQTSLRRSLEPASRKAPRRTCRRFRTCHQTPGRQTQQARHSQKSPRASRQTSYLPQQVRPARVGHHRRRGQARTQQARTQQARAVSGRRGSHHLAPRRTRPGRIVKKVRSRKAALKKLECCWRHRHHRREKA